MSFHQLFEEALPTGRAQLGDISLKIEYCLARSFILKLKPGSFFYHHEEKFIEVAPSPGNSRDPWARGPELAKYLAQHFDEIPPIRQKGETEFLPGRYACQGCRAPGQTQICDTCMAQQHFLNSWKNSKV